MTTATAYTKSQLEMMAEVVASDPGNLFAEHYKTVLANYTLKPDVKAVEAAPKSYGKGTGTGGGKKPLGATSNQLSYIGKLLASRVVPDALRAEAEAPYLAFKAATKLIDALKVCPWLPKEPVKGATKAITKAVGDGFYCHDGVYYKAQYGTTTHNLYCKKWDAEYKEWEYAGKAPLAFLTEDDRLTQAQASEFGALYGQCFKCSKKLTDEFSIAHGYGKICAGKMGF
ncbi:MAG: hypothetical protein JWN15_3479 [Firmicutes bacterium]|nr:hypothetical protein [Bacillota bacterium]